MSKKVSYSGIGDRMLGILMSIINNGDQIKKKKYILFGTLLFNLLLAMSTIILNYVLPKYNIIYASAMVIFSSLSIYIMNKQLKHIEQKHFEEKNILFDRYAFENLIDSHVDIFDNQLIEAGILKNIKESDIQTIDHLLDDIEDRQKKNLYKPFIIANSSAFIIFLLKLSFQTGIVNFMILAGGFIILYLLSLIFMDVMNRNINKYKILSRYLRLLRIKRDISYER